MPRPMGNAPKAMVKRFSESFDAMVLKGQEGGLRGLRSWLEEQNQGSRWAETMLWAEKMGAVDLEELFENLEALEADLHLPSGSLRPGTARPTPRPADREGLWRCLARQPGRELDAFDAAWAKALRAATAVEAETLEATLAEELRKRLRGDLRRGRFFEAFGPVSGRSRAIRGRSGGLRGLLRAQAVPESAPGAAREARVVSTLPGERREDLAGLRDAVSDVMTWCF